MQRSHSAPAVGWPTHTAHSVHMQSAFVPPTCPGVLIVLSMVGLRTLEQMPEAQEYKQQQEWEDFINKAREEDDFDPGADE